MLNKRFIEDLRENSIESLIRRPPMPGAISALKWLKDGRFGENIFLVSKCGPRVQEITREWLVHQQFFEKTGINPEHIRFCLGWDDKAVICYELGITNFIDDRMRILSTLKTVKNLYLFRPRPTEIKLHSQFPSGVLRLNSWEDVLREILL